MTSEATICQFRHIFRDLYASRQTLSPSSPARNSRSSWTIGESATLCSHYPQSNSHRGCMPAHFSRWRTTTAHWDKVGIVLGVGQSRDYQVRLPSNWVWWRSSHFIRIVPSPAAGPLTVAESLTHHQDPPNTSAPRHSEQIRIYVTFFFFRLG